MKICTRCGMNNSENSKFCVECGAPLPTLEEQSAHWHKERRGEEIIYTDVAPRSIAISVILTIVTFGIYGLFWMYHLNNEINELAQDPTAPGGGLVLFLFIITFGIYGLYWYYKMGEKCDYITQTGNHSGIIYLILGLLGLGIVATALMQDAINRVLE